MPDKKPRHAVIITISPELLADFLRLPPGIKITGATHDSLTQVITLRFDAPHFPTVIEGAHPVQARLTYNRKTKKSSISL
jgi:hypothetical protein